MKRWLALVVLAGALLGCHSTRVVWLGHNDARDRVVAVLAKGGTEWVLVDGERQGKTHQRIAPETIAFTPSGQIAYAARAWGNTWRVYFGDEESPQLDGVGALVHSPTRGLGFAAQRDGAWHVCQGIEADCGPAFDAILKGSLQLSPDGADLAYVGTRADGVHVVVNGRVGPPWAGVRRLQWGPGGQLAYVARDAEGSRLVVNERSSPAYDGIGEVVLGAGHHAYAALRDGRWRAVVDGREGTTYRRVDDLQLAPGTERLAYIATEDSGLMLVVNDGVARASFPTIRRDSLRVSPDGRLAWVVASERGQRMYLDGEPSQLFDEVGPAVFAPRTGRWGYIARVDDTAVVVIDGATVAELSSAEDLVWSRDGRRYAFAAQHGDASYLFYDGQRLPVRGIVAGSVVFGPRGANIGYVAHDPEHGLHFAVDGRPYRRFYMTELVDRAALDPEGFRHDDDVLKRWVAAELRLKLEGKR